MPYYCNPINVPYRYSFIKASGDDERIMVNREAADPSMVSYRGKYYLFSSMSGSVLASEDLANWDCVPLPSNVPVYGYAPDVRVVGDWLYFTASGSDAPCSFFRTQNPALGPYEEIPGTFAYWDPNLFADDDGRLYFYWGCSNETPIWGVELDPLTMRPKGCRTELIHGNPREMGYERLGEDHGADHAPVAEKPDAGMPYIEGAWMTKHDGRYYLQYACPGTELNVYADGVYVSDHPLGPFVPAVNNPFSYKPGGFLPGAGHGSTILDESGSWWHTATMRISVNHIFERRIGLWPAGFDMDGELFCNQRYGDWPFDVDDLRKDPWADPKWMLLSCGKRAFASSFEKGREPENATDENVQTWWRAASPQAGQWICVDLGEVMSVHAVQVNFADDPAACIPCPGKMMPESQRERYIDMTLAYTRTLLEGSADGKKWVVIRDRRETDTDLSHDLTVMEEGLRIRFVRLEIAEVPYHVPACISGLRVFGKGNGRAPGRAEAECGRISDLDFTVSAKAAGTVTGYLILWGHGPDKLYHSYMVLGKSVREKRIGGLVKGRSYYVRVDAFNENGIICGEVIPLR